MQQSNSLSTFMIKVEHSGRSWNSKLINITPHNARRNKGIHFMNNSGDCRIGKLKRLNDLRAIQGHTSILFTTDTEEASRNGSFCWHLPSFSDDAP
mmetsp:Transcript_27223/g.51457  ORF Transcript_27223/g.51457 Transcript_27223/m.51457 type:complete len:96 (-) Transcript_27223:82-369(-)